MKSKMVIVFKVIMGFSGDGESQGNISGLCEMGVEIRISGNGVKILKLAFIKKMGSVNSRSDE